MSSANHRTIVECGAGLSTIILARRLDERSGRNDTLQARLYTLEHDPRWVRETDAALQRLELRRHVELIHAPIVACLTGQHTAKTYDVTKLPNRPIDFLFIDGPPTPNVGRIDVVPALRNRLSRNATVILDDAARPHERECVEEWTTRFGMTLERLLVIGRGLAVMRYLGES